MTDQTIPADQVREIVEKMYHHANHDNVRGTEEEYVRFFARQFDELLPAPTPPTLADMTTEERNACRWMQADAAECNTRYVIANPDDGDDEVALIAADGRIEWIFPECVTPRPDLPRMEWPGAENAAPAPTLPDGWRFAEHPDHGLIIVTNTTPSENGIVYFVLPAADPLGYDWHFCDPEELTYLPQ